MTASYDEDELELRPAGEITDPDALAAIAAMTGEDDSKAPVIEPPRGGPLRLPVGLRVLTPGIGAEYVKDVWVTELDGFAEERIAKVLAKDPTLLVQTLLEVGVERLGQTPATPDQLSDLTLGDRDFLLLEISKATYGDDLEYENYLCEHCGEFINFTLPKGDIPIRDGNLPDVDRFEFETRKGATLHVNLPTGEDQEEARKGGTPAEFNTILMSRVVEEFEGSVEAARKLSIPDRQALVIKMAEVMPGPRYNEVKFEHPECGKEVRPEVTLADLFPGF